MDSRAQSKDFPTTMMWILIVTGAALSIVGYVRLGGAYYPCSPGGSGLCFSTEYPFDLAAVYSGLVLVLGGFVGYAIVLHNSRTKQRNNPVGKGGPQPFSVPKS